MELAEGRNPRYGTRDRAAEMMAFHLKRSGLPVSKAARSCKVS